MLTAALAEGRPVCCGAAAPSTVISGRPVCLVLQSPFSLLPSRLGVSGARKPWGLEKANPKLVVSNPCVTLGVELPRVGGAPCLSFLQSSLHHFSFSGLKLELSRGLCYPPPSSVTSVNGFLITHINQHDWKFLKFYWEGNL